MQAGQKVRIKTDPSKVGILSDRSQKIGRRLKLGVEFQDGGHEYILEGLLELVPGDESLEDLIASGLYAGRQVLRNSLTYRRLSGRLANVIYSMESTNTDFYPYQFKPVLNLLDSPSKGLLIADEVGLGKTIEAGLIWTELRSRLDANKLLVICPAMLREKWVRELRNKFGVQAQMANALDLQNTLKQSISGEISGFALVCSKDGLRPPRGFEDVEEPSAGSPRSVLASLLADSASEDPLFDLVVVDEAHYLRNQETMTSKLGQLIRPVTDYLVLLSATPVQLDSQDLYQLLRILDERTYSNLDSFKRILAANEPINAMIDALSKGSLSKDEFHNLLDAASKHPVLSTNRQLEHLRGKEFDSQELAKPEVRASIAGDLASVNLLSKSVSRTRKREVTEWRVVREPIAEHIEMHSLELDFYERVTATVADFCLGKDISRGFLLATPQRQISSCMPAAIRSWRNKLPLDDLEEDFFDEPDQEIEGQTSRPDLGPLTTHLALEADALGSFDLLKKCDTKYERLETLLKRLFRDRPDEKVLVFSYFRETIKYLSERLAEVGIQSSTLMGGMKDNKDDVAQKFENDPNIRVLLASEVASEGIDLQFCRVLVNYDLPWNPMKVEQRIGRIDRIGQKADKITIWNLFYKETIDEKIYLRLHKRLGVFEYSLGGLEPVLGEIHRMSYDLLSGGLSEAQQVARVEQTEQAIANLRRENASLEDKATYLIAHSEYILNEVTAAKTMRRFVTGKDLADYFFDFYSTQYPGCFFRQSSPEELIFEIRLTADAKKDLQDFLRKIKLGSHSLLLSEPAFEYRFLFDNKAKQSQSNLEVVSQFHPAIRFINLNLKDRRENLVPSAIIVSSLDTDNLLPGLYGFFVKRWQVTGVRNFEKLAYSAINLSHDQCLSEDLSESLISLASGAGNDWASARNEVDAELTELGYEKCEDHLEVLYQDYISRLISENEDRADILSSTARNHFAAQIDSINLTISRFKSEGRHKMIPANEGKIKKLDSKLASRLEDIERGRVMNHSASDVALGVIKVV
jgi:superfamily II DNA or RNA helicase